MLINWYRNLLFTLLLVTLATPTGAGPLSYGPPDAKSANYLAFLDHGQFAEAWSSMSELFRALNDRQHWMESNQAIRNAYGPLVTREALHTSYRKTYKNSPDGQYVIIQFASIFAHKSSAVETVVLECNDSPSCSVREYIIN